MKKAVIAGCLAVFVASFAHAGFVDEDAATQVQLVGKTIPTDVASGLGNNVSFNEALQQIVPRGYLIETTGVSKEDLERKVNWRGGRSWVDTLKELLQHSAWISAKIDTTNRVVTLTADNGSRASVVGSNGVWRMRRGEKVGDAVAAWGKAAGWRGVYWEGPELEVDMDQVLPGSFEDAINTVVETLRKQGFNLTAKFYEGNKVVRILEKK